MVLRWKTGASWSGSCHKATNVVTHRTLKEVGKNWLRDKKSLWTSPVARGWMLQTAVFVLVVAFVWFLAANTTANLDRQHIASGFGYLNREAGFAIGDTVIAYSPADSYAHAIAVGFLNTLKVAIIGIVVATVFGTLIGVSRLSPNWLLSKICECYVEIFRNVPLLLWLFLFYKLIRDAFPGPRQAISLFGTIFLSNRGLYIPTPLNDPLYPWLAVALLTGIALAIVAHRWARRRQDQTGLPFPSALASCVLIIAPPLATWLLYGAPLQISWPRLTGFNFDGGSVIQPEFTALIVGLVMYNSAFIAEIVRSGILALNVGQSEAGIALGFNRMQVMKLILLPQAMRVIIPPMTSQYLSIAKASSLAIAIGYPDLVAVINVTINQTGQAIENVTIIMLAYLSISLFISLVMNIYNRRMSPKER